LEYLDKVNESIRTGSREMVEMGVSSTIGDDIIGIWPKDVKKDHINCAHATSSTIVTGDDNGAVNLFKFPCPEQGVRVSC
jgi:hypothetical protein